MPFYVYKCPGCGHQEELTRRMSQMDDMVVCPNLECVRLLKERVEINRTARPQLKGEGFHATDYFNSKRPWDSMPDHPPQDVPGKYTEIDKTGKPTGGEH